MFGKNKKLYKYTGKFDGQKKYKEIVETNMVSTPEVLTDNSPMAVFM